MEQLSPIEAVGQDSARVQQKRVLTEQLSAPRDEELASVINRLLSSAQNERSGDAYNPELLLEMYREMRPDQQEAFLLATLSSSEQVLDEAQRAVDTGRPADDGWRIYKEATLAAHLRLLLTLKADSLPLEMDDFTRRTYAFALIAQGATPLLPTALEARAQLGVISDMEIAVAAQAEGLFALHGFRVAVRLKGIQAAERYLSHWIRQVVNQRKYDTIPDILQILVREFPEDIDRLRTMIRQELVQFPRNVRLAIEKVLESN